MAAALALAAVPEKAACSDFGDDLVFLKKHTEVLVLSDALGDARVAVAPAWQGRVMTSTAQGDSGASFGWINRELIGSGRLQPHINVFGGEERLWLGPEGGQFSIYFAPGAKFDLDNWFVPAALDTQPFSMVSHTRDRAAFRREFTVTNWTGTRFTVTVRREVRVLDRQRAFQILGLSASKKIALVAYESVNTLTNSGAQPWKKDTGLLSIWILGMFNPSSSATIVVPLKAAPNDDLRSGVTSDYFGVVPPERLKVTCRMAVFSGDGTFRSKIGINPTRSLGKLGSYDADHHVLTLVLFDQPAGVTEYVNSLWNLQENPYSGDAANSYNDGPPVPGAKPLGPFYELESSSPAAALSPGARITHTRTTLHLTGPEGDLDAIARHTLGVSLAEIRSALKGP